MAKKKVELNPAINVDQILSKIERLYADSESDISISTIDGVKIDFQTKWVHLRKSNTEPIIRIYSEAPTLAEADEIADEIIQKIMAESNIK